MADSNRISLNGKWNIRDSKGDYSIRGSVPGVVHNDLINLKIVDEPLFRDNELKQQWVGEKGWHYSREFNLSKDQIQRESVILDCDGLDTLATIYVNDIKVGTTDNMFIRHRINIKKAVKAGRNTVLIAFAPVIPEIEKRRKAYHIDIPAGVERPWQSRYRAFVRKSATHRGWDWGPSFMVQGIYRDIAVECRNGASIIYVTNVQKHSKEGVKIDITAIIDSPSASDAELTFNIDSQTICAKVKLAAGENSITRSITIKKPKLWWPNGFGEQPLYPLSVTVASCGEVHAHTQRIGLRTVELITEKDKAGETFFFRVNGVDVFMKGANWIPSEVFDSRLTDEDIEWELRSASAANHNCIRVWGGGLYERDSFYNLCDELGLLVWQDLMFACALFPTTESFLDSVRDEVRHQIRRLQHHSSIALWCGNNENEEAMRWFGKQDRDKLVTYAAEYDRLYVTTIAPVLAKEDPSRRYWPSSPSNGLGAYGDPDDQTRGDVHYWKVWHANEPFTIYQSVTPRFCSEFGFQSFSSPESMDEVTDKNDRNICSPVFEFHQRSGVGNLKILEHICRHFRLPHGYENMLYVSQALQGLSIKVGVEHWRRIKPHNMGTIYWQLNDIWPCASWSSLEYDGRWKMLHYESRKFFAPLLVSMYEKDGSIEVWGTSDIEESLTGKLTVTQYNLQGKTLKRKALPVKLKKQESRLLTQLNISTLIPNGVGENNTFLHAKLDLNGHTASNEYFFKPFKYLELEDPKIKTEIKSIQNGMFEFTLTARSFAPYVWIRTGKTYGLFTDNGMHLLPGKPLKLKFKPRTAISIDKLRKDTVVQNLFDACK